MSLWSGRWGATEGARADPSPGVRHDLGRSGSDVEDGQEVERRGLGILVLRLGRKSGGMTLN